MSGPKIIGMTPQRIVEYVKKTAGYYNESLGFNILGIIGNPPVYAMVERDGFQVHFAKSDLKTIKTNVEYRSISHDFILWVPEIDTF